MLVLWLGDYTPQSPVDADGADRRASGWASASPCASAWRRRCGRWRICWKPCAKAIIPSARGSKSGDAMGEVMQQVNAMSATLRAQRLGALEATTLLRKVMEEIDVAVFAFDGEQQLRLVNRAGERLLNEPAERLLVDRRSMLGLSQYLEGEAQRTVQRTFPGRNGALGHQPQHVSRRRAAASIAGGDRSDAAAARRRIEGLAAAGARAGARAEQFARAHQVHRGKPGKHPGARSSAGGLGGGYAPGTGGDRRAQRSVEPLYGRLCAARQAASADWRRWTWRSWSGASQVWKRASHRALQLGPEIDDPGGCRSAGTIADQCDPQRRGRIARNRRRRAGGLGTAELALMVWVRDEGHGLPNTANLFVPFFTTKPSGSGIGLVLSRQIAEAHGGTLTLQNAPDGPGCEARLVLPLS